MTRSPSEEAKRKRYDRQIRIWGAHGQDALESARLCLLNAGPTGSETLKNLVLGGIASFTIVDGAKVQESDLGNNFFLEQESIGQPRAQCVTALLKELNESVEGVFRDESPEELIATDPAFFQNFNLVIATQMQESHLVKLDEICRKEGVMLLIARSYGLVGLFRASLPEHTVVESKPDSGLDDLRFHKPWQELKTYALSFNMDELDNVMHRHVPYGVLLIQAAEQWYAEHEGQLPKNYPEQKQFKAMLQAGVRQVEGVPLDEDNYKEAIAAAHKLYCPPPFPPGVRAILEDEAIEVTKESSNFWIMAAAMKEFIAKEGDGDLPLEGSVPDMTASTMDYLGLQRIYRERADRDASAVEAHARSICQRLGRDPVPKAYARLFCKNARNLAVVRFRSLSAEFSSETCHSDVLRSALFDEEKARNAALYLLVRAVDRFFATYMRYPGSYDSGVDEDVPLLKSIASGLMAECGITNAIISDDLVLEMCRFGAAEIHTIAAIMGGIASQEAIKLLTGQFLPCSGTLTWNGMSGTSNVFQL